MTNEDAEKFADWIIKQEKKIMDLKYPKAEGTEHLTDEELLELLFDKNEGN